MNTPSTDAPLLAEEFLTGQELCFDTITIDDKPCFYSICHYRRPILEVLENPALRWGCIMPRDISNARYQPVISSGLAAIRALRVGNAVTHMEGFLADNGAVKFGDATLRPAGARIAPMLAHAYNINPHRAWARCTVDGRFDGPFERQYAVGTLFIRNQGKGRVEAVEGIETIRRRLGRCLVESHPPVIGAQKAVTYTGDGFLTVRHPETAFVEDALDMIDDTVVVQYSEAGRHQPPRNTWAAQMAYIEQGRCKPAWEEYADPQLTIGED
jgi:hypothetical protein